MRKKIFAVVSLITILAMESMTVFATETGTGNGSPTAAAVTVDNVTVDEANGTVTTAQNITLIVNTENTRMSYTATPAGSVGDSESAITTSSSLANAVISVVSDDSNSEGGDDKKGRVVEQTLSTEDKVNLANKIDSITSEAKAGGAETVEYLCVNLEYVDDVLEEGESVQVAFNVDGLTEARAKKIIILHLRSDGFWEQIPVTFVNGKLIGTISSFSPFLIIEFDEEVVGLTTDADYSTPTVTGTVSGAISPKTAEAEPYKTVAALALIAIAGVAICSRKLINK
jgi:ribosomal protein L3